MKEPFSAKAKEDLRFSKLIRHFYRESDGIYGSPRIFKDLREQGESCGKNRMARLMKVAGIKAIRGYKKNKYYYTKPSEACPNRLKQQARSGLGDRHHPN